jgi:CHAT domain-containing protein/uncharacterized protein HemY
MAFRNSKVAMTRQSRLKRGGHLWLFVLVLICSFWGKESSAHFTNPTGPRPSNFETSVLLARLQQDPLVAGTELLQAGQKLDAENTNESHLKAIEKYKEAAKLFHASKVNLGEAVAWLAAASSYSSLHQDQNTLEYAKLALPLLEGKESDRTILASTLNIVGMAYSSTGNQKTALEYFNRALPLAEQENNPLLLAPTLTGIGTAHAYLGERQKATEYYDKALTLFRSAGDHGGEATTLNVMAAIYSKLGEKQKALSLFNQAIPLLRQSRNPAGEVSALSGIADTYNSLGQSQRALDYYNQALTLATTFDDGPEKSTALNNMGEIYDGLGDKQHALDLFDRALQISRKIYGLKGGADSLNNIGAVYRSMGEYQKALDYYFKALDSARADKDMAAEASILDNIGVVYLGLDQNQKALGYFLQAQPIFHAIGDRSNEAMTLNLIGDFYDSSGDYRKELDLNNQALAFARAIQEPGAEANALSHIAWVNWKLGENQKALEIYNHALTIINTLGRRDDKGPILHNMGAIYAKSSDNKKALDYYEQALSIAQEINDRRGQANTFGDIGSLYENQGNLEKAIEQYQRAIEIQERIRSEARLEEFRIKLAEQSANIYAHAILCNMRAGHPMQAFNLNERARARSFLDQLGNARIDVRKGANDEVIHQEQALRSQLTSLEAQRSKERARPGGATGETISALETQLQAKRVEYEDFLTELKLKAPAYASIFSVDSLQLPEIQKLLDKDTTLLSYYVTQDTTLVFVVSRESFQAVSLPIKGDEISAQLVRFRDFSDLSNPRPASLKELYRMLIAPVEPYLRTKLVGIIPHNILHYLPFAALLKGDRFFGDDHVLFYLPSASVLAFRQSNDKSAGGSLLALAQGQAEGLPFLEYAASSAEKIAQLYNSQALVAEAATETAFRQRSINSNVVFVAAHAKLDTVTPMFSQIILAPDKDNDGRLEVHEVYGFDLTKTSLVVLSGCETQLGERSRGDDLIGLNRAFIYAGARTVMASLWSVKDKQTGELMVSYFDYVKQGLTKGEALQRAQLDVRSKYPHPYYWASFVLTGDSGAVQPTHH